MVAEITSSEHAADAPGVDAESTSSGIWRFVPSLYVVAALAVLGGIFVVALLPHVEADFWWHIKVGQYIASHYEVPTRDFLSFTFAGHTWTDHEWLTELAMYGLFRAFGEWGPIAVFAAVVCLAFAVAYRTMRLQQIHPVLGLFVLAAAYTASRGSVGARVQMITLLFLSLYVLVLARYGETRSRRLLFVFPVTIVLWANMHGGFVLGLVLIVITIVGETFNCVTGRPGAWKREDIQALAVTLLITTASTVINPNGVRELLYPLAFILPNAYTNLIEESASPNFHMTVMMLFESMLLLLITSVMVARPRLNWTHLFLVMAFTHLALSQVRNVPLWMIVISPILALYMQQAGQVLARQWPQWHYQRRPVRGKLGPVLNLVMLAMIAVVYLFEVHTYITPHALHQYERQIFPTEAVAYLKSQRLPSRVYTTYAWGGYLLWNLSPRYADFMDSRADTLFDTRILNDYLKIYQASPGWEQVMDQYRVQVVLIDTTTPLSQWLLHDRSWKLRYQDHIAQIFERRSLL